MDVYYLEIPQSLVYTQTKPLEQDEQISLSEEESSVYNIMSDQRLSEFHHQTEFYVREVITFNQLGRNISEQLQLLLMITEAIRREMSHYTKKKLHWAFERNDSFRPEDIVYACAIRCWTRMDGS